MRNLFTEDFFKNSIGFATILIFALVIIGVAGYADSEWGEQTAQPTAETTN